jgi:hypothetical protein
MIQDILKRYDEIFGEEHHKICEGKNCKCYKDVKQFIIEEIEEILWDYSRLLEKKGHLDSDYYCEEPRTVDEYLGKKQELKY